MYTHGEEENKYNSDNVTSIQNFEGRKSPEIPI